MVRTLGILALAPVVVCSVAGWSCKGPADVTCDDLGGTIDSDQMCRVQTVTSTYTQDFTFPVSYPDPQPLTDFLVQTRDDWAEFAEMQAPHNRPPYHLTISGTTYRSGDPATGTQSVVLKLDSDFGAHPVSSFQAFNYDVGKGTPITFDTLFEPGTDPLEVLTPIVQRELETHELGVRPPFDDAGVYVYQDFAITDDAVIFFFDQGEVAPQFAGPQTVSVPRTEIASLLA